MFTTFAVGRSASADIQFDDPSVSRRQIEITVTDQQRYYVTACGGSTPTHVWRDGQWNVLIQSYLEADAWLAFGSRKVHLRDLINEIYAVPRKTPGSAAQIEPVSVKPRRKVSTGEVEVIRSGG